MDVIPSTLTAFLGGINETAVFATGAFKRCLVSFTADGFPVGSTAVDVLFSTDGGSTFPFQGGNSFVGPAVFDIKFAHVYSMGFEIASQPSHVKVRTTAPLAFNSTVTVTMQ